MKKKGLLVVLSGPSGSGKGTLIKQLMEQQQNLYLSVSVATRLPREGEVNGEHYQFMDKKEFERLIERGEMLEYAQYCDHYYGTPKENVFKRCEQGIDVILEIEVQGAMQVKVRYPEAVLVFLIPPSMDELKRRLVERNTESIEDIQHRLKVSRDEIACAERYDYMVINDQIDQAVGDLIAILRSEKNKTIRMQNGLQWIK